MKGGMSYQPTSGSKPLNTYAYAVNNPSFYTDPLGLDAEATIATGLAVWGGTSLSDGPLPIGEVVGGIAFVGFAAYAGYQYCTSDDNEEEKRKKNCQALKDSILNTCYGLTGRKRMACFEAANTAYRQCMGYE